MWDGTNGDLAPIGAPFIDPPAKRTTPVKEPLPLTDAFNKINAVIENAVTLRVYNGGIYAYYDFAQRVRMSSITGSQVVTPFSELDRETLVAARDKLVELGGQPPQLPPEAPTLNKPARGLNP